MPADTTTCVVASLRRLSPLVYELDLKAPRPFAWLPGQWASLHLPVGQHQPLVRAYSLAEPPDGTEQLPLVFDVVDDGFGSSHLASLRPGDTVEVAAVMGKFTLPADPDIDILFGARLTGIVPVRAMLMELAGRTAAHRVRLVYGAPTPEDLVFHDELTRLAASAEWFEYHPTVHKAHPSWPGAVGEELEILRGLSATGAPYVPMLSGVRAFTGPARDFLMGERGFERRSVKVENYD